MILLQGVRSLSQTESAPDRKLRVVSKIHPLMNGNDGRDEPWRASTVMISGDSLLLARENILYTYISIDRKSLRRP